MESMLTRSNLAIYDGSFILMGTKGMDTIFPADDQWRL
jgi:hypothetical protein